MVWEGERVKTERERGGGRWIRGRREGLRGGVRERVGGRERERERRRRRR